MPETSGPSTSAFLRVRDVVARALHDSGWRVAVAARGAGPWVLTPSAPDAAHPEPLGETLAAALASGGRGLIDDATAILPWPTTPSRALVLRATTPVPGPLPLTLLGALVEEAARAERTERLEEAVGEGLLLADPSGLVSVASETAARLLGHREPLEGAQVARLLPSLHRGNDGPELEPGELASGPLRARPDGTRGTWTAESLPSGQVLVRLEVHRGATRAEQLRLLSTLRHDLRAPLSAMQALIGVLASEPEMPPAERARMLTLLELESERTRDFIDACLTVLRLRLDPRPETPRAVELTRVIDAVGSALKPSLASRGVTLSISTAAGLVEADPTLLEPFLKSALGFVLRLAEAGAVVDLSADEAGLEITGRGPGLFDRPLERPFTSSGRATSSGKRTPGAALGLVVARRIADAHGWKLYVHQRPGTVTVRACWRHHA
jgi:signal transduction histidine kinase